MSNASVKSRAERSLEEPGVLAVATMYAQAYVDGAKRVGEPDAVETLSSFLDDVLAVNPEYREMLFGDSLNRSRKLALIRAVIASAASEFFTNFLQVLARHGRLSVLPEICEVAIRLQERSNGRQRVKVRSAVPLSDSTRTQVCEALKSQFGFEAILQESVDASLLGGIVLQVGDTVYDSSLRSRLKTLQGRLVERAFNEIQIGRDRFSHPDGD